MRNVIDREEETDDSEITLNATTLLGIFFGLVLICGVFFGFGYSVGRRGTTPTAAAPAAAMPEESPMPSAAPAPKPSGMESLQAADSDDPNTITQPINVDSGSASATNKPVAAQVKQAVLAPDSAPKPSPASTNKPEVKPVSLPVTSPTNPAAVAPSGAIMVQIAAVTHQEDANVLVSALRQRGYSVSIRNEPQDKLLHVQVGPFASRDAARVMRSKLLADGYNAILKQ